MGGKLGLSVVLAVGLLTAGGCSGGDKPPPLEQNPTVQEECESALEALCKRGVTDCQIYSYGTTEKDCVDTSVPQCCQQSCKSIAVSTQAQVEKCRAVLADYSCDALAQDVIPPECQGVVRYYQN